MHKMVWFVITIVLTVVIVRADATAQVESTRTSVDEASRRLDSLLQNLTIRVPYNKTGEHSFDCTIEVDCTHTIVNGIFDHDSSIPICAGYPPSHQSYSMKEFAEHRTSDSDEVRVLLHVTRHGAIPVARDTTGLWGMRWVDTTLTYNSTMIFEHPLVFCEWISANSVYLENAMPGYENFLAMLKRVSQHVDVKKMLLVR